MKIKQELVSIIVTIYNIERYLERCIESIINQDYKMLEVILVDDGSTDGSSIICDRYAAKDDRIQVIHKKNEGLVRARKTGLSQATGRYIGFVDGDDFIDKDMYRRLVDNIEETGADFVHSGYVVEGKRIIMPEVEVFDLEKDEDTELFLKEYILDQDSETYISPSIWSKLFKAELVKKSYESVPDDQSIGEDWINIVECVFHCKRISIVDVHAYHYMVRKGSLSHLENVDDLLWQSGYYRALKDVLKKHDFFEKTKEVLDGLLINTILFCIERRYPDDFIVTRYAFEKIDMILDKKVVLYGAGIVGKSYYSQISRYPECQIVGWIDNRHENILYEYIDVLGRERLKDIVFDYLIIAVKDKEAAKSIKERLIFENGVEETKIIWERPRLTYKVK